MGARPAILERVPRLSRHEFQERYVATSTPVIVTEMLSETPAMTRWSPLYLKDTLGDIPRPTDRFPNGNCYQEGIHGEMTAKEYFGRMVSRKHRDDVLYMAGNPSHFPELSSDFALPELVAKDRYQSMLYWFGYESVTQGHYHPYSEALLCCVVGDKKVLLYPPEDHHRLRLYPWYSRHYNFSSARIDQQNLPDFGGVRPFERLIRRGEMLYIPLDWIHFVFGQGFTANVTVLWRPEAPLLGYPRARAALQRLRARFYDI